MSQKVCCVPGCPTVAGDGISLHRFPNPNRNIDLFKVWLKKIGGHVAELDQEYIYSNRRVCRRHFEDVYLYPKKLCSLAIPSLCLADCGQLPAEHKDTADLLINLLKNLIKSNENNGEENTENIELDIDDLNIENVNTNKLLEGKSPTDVERCAAVAYCSGWLVTRVQRKVFKSCPVCIEIFKSKELEAFHKHIKISEYNNKGWLCYPTRNIFDCFAEIENHVIEIKKKKK